MDAYPFISVIIPNYNHARYLDQRIQSVLGQTYQNFEVIILDDCSTDNSLEVIEKYRSNPHVSDVIVNEKNSGNTFLQWDKGIKTAKGDWIWIAESDDYCEPNLLEELVKAAEHKKDTVLAYSTFKVVFDDDKPSEYARNFPNQYMSGKTYLRQYLSLSCAVQNASCAIFRKDVALKVGSAYKTMAGAGDYLFWVKITEQGRVAIVNKQLSYFRRHSGVVTAKRNTDGSNMVAEKSIFDYVRSKVWLSPLRVRYIFAHHARRVRYAGFDTPEIRDKVFDLWKVDAHIGWFDNWLLRIGDAFVNKYNYYL